MIVAWSKSTRSWGVEQRIDTEMFNTLTTGLGCRNQSTMNLIAVDDDIRMLTPLECERLQGFPDNYTDNLKDTKRYKAVGNAVMVPVIEWIARRLQ